MSLTNVVRKGQQRTRRWQEKESAGVEAKTRLIFIHSSLTFIFLLFPIHVSFSLLSLSLSVFLSPSVSTNTCKSSTGSTTVHDLRILPLSTSFLVSVKLRACVEVGLKTCDFITWRMMKRLTGRQSYGDWKKRNNFLSLRREVLEAAVTREDVFTDRAWNKKYEEGRKMMKCSGWSRMFLLETVWAASVVGWRHDKRGSKSRGGRNGMEHTFIHPVS